MQCDIILRTCDRVYTVHKSDRGDVPRVLGRDISKLEIISRCINSLVQAINVVEGDLRLVVIDDNSSSDALEMIAEAIRICRYPGELIQMTTQGNGESMGACYKWAKSDGREYLYFVEDDYLHDRMCIAEMLTDLEQFKFMLRGYEVAMNPCDNPDNYMQAAKNGIASFIALGSRRHWRTVSNSAATFLCSQTILRRYWYLFNRMADYGVDPTVNEDNTINKIWQAPYTQAGGAYMLSPIPALACHLHYEEHLSPFVDWRKWWQESSVI